MTGTDKAFIRVYGDQRTLKPNPTEPPQSSPPMSSDPVTVPYVSQFFTAATHGNVPVSSGANRRSTTVTTKRQHQRPVPQPPVPSARYMLGVIGAPAVDSTNRVDGSQSLAPPHLSAASLRGAGGQQPAGGNVGRIDPRHAGLPMQPRSLRPFRPQWEVDNFVLPEVCTRLQTESSIGLAELFRAVLMRAWRGRPVVAISAFGRGEGSTTVTLCIARLAATFATRVGIIDGNVVHPSIAEMLGLTVRNSWASATPDQPLTESAIGAGDDRMVILPLNSPPEDEVITAARARAASTIQTLRECFDLILIDAGPIFHAAHLWFRDGLHRSIDAAVVVRDVRNTSPLQLEDVCLRIRQAGIQDVSVVENFQTPSLAVG